MTKSWSEALRREIWWSEIDRRRDGRTNYQLSMLVTNQWGEGVPGIDRRRLFESAVRGAHPIGLPGGLSLAQAAEVIPGFEGTAAIFHSPIWELLSGRGQTLLEISSLAENELLDCCMERHMPDTHRFMRGPQYVADWRQSLISQIRTLPDIRYLSILATLCSEACACGASEFDEALRRMFDDALQLSAFGQRIIGSVDYEIYTRVIDAICYPNLSELARGDQRSKVAFRVRQFFQQRSLPSSSAIG